MAARRRAPALAGLARAALTTTSSPAPPPPGALAGTARRGAGAGAGGGGLLARLAHTDRTAYAPESLPLDTGRPRLVVLGVGWAAARLLRDIDTKCYDVTVISPRNHMVFTPLLASTTVGTVGTRSVALHVTTIQKALHQPQNGYVQAKATAVFPDRRLIEAESDDGVKFFVPYDKLAICTGSQGSTFGIPGVEEHAHFLRDVRHAEAIRSALIQNIALAGVPGRPLDDYNRLLHVVIVGGGPTGVEVAGELSNLINRDLRHVYPDRAKAMRVTVIEAKELLGSFDGSLREYAARKLVAQGVKLRKGVVRCVEAQSLTLTDGTVIPFGLCIWSTGVGPTPFTLSLPFAKTKVGRVAVDPYLRVLAPPLQPGGAGPVRAEGEAVGVKGQITQLTREHSSEVADLFNPAKAAAAAAAAPGGGQPASGGGEAGSSAGLAPVDGVYALGDCCANVDSPLPPLAQVAEQQGKYLAAVLNGEARNLNPTQVCAARAPAAGGQGAAAAAFELKPFRYKQLGSMATVGGTNAVLQFGGGSGDGTFTLAGRRLSVAGFISWVAWRSAYLTRLGTLRARMQVAFDWTVTILFGRDLSRWACPKGTVSNGGGPIELAGCLPPPKRGADIAADVLDAEALGDALASTSYQPCVWVAVKRGAERATYGGYSCSLGTSADAKPECAPDADALLENWPLSGCAPSLAKLLSFAERHACIEALKYPYNGETFQCTVRPFNFKTWEDAGLTAVQCCVVGRPRAGGAAAADAPPPGTSGYPTTEGLSGVALPPMNASLVPSTLTVPAYNGTALPGDLDLGVKGRPIGLVEGDFNVTFDPKRYANHTVDNATVTADAEAEIVAGCARDNDTACAAALATADGDLAAAAAARAKLAAAVAANSSWAPLLNPPLAASFVRPPLGGDLLAPAPAGGPRVLRWPDSDLAAATGGDMWAPDANTTRAAYSLLVAAELLALTADGDDVPQITFSPVSGVVTILTVLPENRVSGLKPERLNALEARVAKLREALKKSSIDNTITTFVSRVQTIHKYAKKLAEHLDKAEQFAKVMERISSALVKRVVQILVKVLKVTEANAKSTVKARALLVVAAAPAAAAAAAGAPAEAGRCGWAGRPRARLTPRGAAQVAQRLLDASLKAQKLGKLLKKQMIILEAQLGTGRALLCIIDTVRGRKDSDALLQGIDATPQAQAYMASLYATELAVDAQLLVVEVLEDFLPDIKVLQPLEDVITLLANIIGGFVDSIIDPLLDLLRRALCINVFGWKKCISLLDVLEGVSRLFKWALGWAEELLNSLLEPLWRPVEEWIARLVDALVPDLKLPDWARLPSLPELTFINLDQLIADIRAQLLSRFTSDKLALRNVEGAVTSKNPSAFAVAVGIWRGQLVCWKGESVKDWEQVAFGKCRSVPRKYWETPVYGYPRMLKTYESLRRAADTEGRRQHTYEAYTASLVFPIDCAAHRERCNAYLVSLALPDLPPTCADIIDRVIRP
ncbi:NDA1 [Scenedesmus sp. PABB004]|nr:NDA1 [Scenedesmus sp. PABB004]